MTSSEPSQAAPIDDGSSVSIDTGDSWQRLASIAILYFTVANIKNMAQGLIYTVPALAITFNQAESGGRDYLYWGIAGLVAVMTLSGLISFFMYRFRVHNQHVEIHSGVFSRKYTNLPFWRIQNVKIELPFYYRPFGYALVVLDTAGSASEEANIVAVPLQYAHELRRQVLAQQDSKDNVPHQEDDAQPTEMADVHQDEVVLNRRSVGDIVIHGITNNRVWIILGAAAPFYDDVFSYIADWLADKGLQLNQLVGEQTVLWWQMGLYVLVMVMIVMALVALLSVGGALLTFYGYTLSQHQDRYIRRSGLLNKQEVSMRASRIQMITAKQDWLDKLLKRVNLYFEQNTSMTRQAQELMSPNRMIVPSVTEDEAMALSQEVMPASNLKRNDYTPINKRFILHWVAIAVVMPLTLVIGLAVGVDDPKLGVIAVGGACIIFLLVLLRWWRWGIAYDGQYLYVRRGRIGVDYLCFEPYKLQQVVKKQSWFMRRRKLASIKFVLASGSVTVPFLPEAYVDKLADEVLFEVESTRRSWM
jgi:putative membrane protein